MKKVNIKIAYILFVVLVSIRLFSFILVPELAYDTLEIFLIFSLIFLMLFGQKYQGIFKLNIIAMLILTYTSMFSSYIFHSQSFAHSFFVARIGLLFFFYFILMKFQIEKEKLSKVIFYIGIFWAFIMYFQQSIYPQIYFSALNEIEIEKIGRSMETRGLYRFFISGLEYGIFAFFISWSNLTKKMTFRNFAFFLFLFGAIFLTGTRQILAGVLITIIFDIIIKIFKMRIKYLIMSCLIIIILIVLSPFWINNISILLELSSEQDVISSEYIRIQEFNFFIYEFWPHWITIFIGNGWEYHASLYGQYMINNVAGVLRYYRSDIGIFGAMNKFGVLYVFNILLIYKKILLNGKRILVPLYLKLFFIYMFITSFTGGNYFERPSNFILIIICLYLIEKQNEKNIDSNTYSQ